ncbi:type 1 glutamine amidotransferase [Catenulispora subtropica]|uniref:Glutamine amidotransferase domain-containing protein n=1 Tax=Catenulispora subtropica TaxID=450798 RepID=A0ABP5D2L7_9ACTN
MRILIIQHEDGTGPGLVGDRLAALGAELDLRHPWNGEDLPADLSGHDALIVLGGAQAAYEPIGWWPPVFELLREAVRRDLPTLAICLGAQLLAVACGGEVRRAARSEVGLCTPVRYPTPDDLFDTLPVGARTVQWHGDEISVLPDGAVPLMHCADGFPHQAYRMGSRVWAVQFHPEVLAAETRLWSVSDPIIDAEAVLDDIAAAENELRRVWGAFSERWYALAADPAIASAAPAPPAASAATALSAAPTATAGSAATAEPVS